MGCWNGTCAISNLPITWNEPVKLVFLQGEYKYFGMSAFYDATDFMAPAFLPIDAIYNDYGSVENVKENWNTEIITKYFKRRYGSQVKHKHNKEELVETTIENVTYLIERGLSNSVEILEQYTPTDIGPAPDQNDMEKYKEWLDKYIDNTKKDKKPLSFVLVRKDVWDKLVTVMGNYKNGFYHSFHVELDDYGKKLTFKEFLLFELNAKLEKYKESKNITDPIKRLTFDLIKADLSPFREQYSKENTILANEYHEYFFNNIDNEKLKNQIINDWLEYKLINLFMNYTRKAWSLHPGAGSQNTGWNLYAAFSKVINEISIEKQKEYNDEYGEEEDDSENETF